MDERDAREAELRQQLHQLDREREGSALTPGELRKNEDERRAVREELRAMGAEPAPPPAAAG